MSGVLARADAEIHVPVGRTVHAEEVFAALESFPWPPCRSRANVRPDGQARLEAFCLGVVNSYSVGLTCSRMTRTMKNLAKLLVALQGQIPQPDQRCSTIQCNRNYSAKLHVDANNCGIGWILGLGPYGLGGFWIMNPGGKKVNEDDVPMTVMEPLKGYDFRPQDVIYGRVHDIRGKWFCFDGRVPHAAMPYTAGPRVSLVFFCRKGCDKINETDRNSFGTILAERMNNPFFFGPRQD